MIRTSPAAVLQPAPSERSDDAALVLLGVGAGGLDGIPVEVFDAAVRIHLAPSRVDMKALAEQLGIGRRTLYRQVGDREQLLGEVVWFLLRSLLARALRLPESLSGRDRLREFARRLMFSLQDQPAYWRFIREEPSAALRVLTSVDGPVQPRMVEVVDRLLAIEEARGALSFASRRRSIAYAIVRVAEAFLYGDVVAGVEPDLARAIDVIDMILKGGEVMELPAEDSRAGAADPPREIEAETLRVPVMGL